MHNLRISSHFDLFAKDLLAERSFRPMIIVGASKVDHLLLEILEHFLLPKIARKRDQDELLEGNSPLATFSARTKVCRRLGLIDETLYSTLERLRSLRNLNAHSISFDHTKSPVRDHIDELRKLIHSRPSYKLTKKKYFEGRPFLAFEELQCLLLTLCLLLQAIREKVVRTVGNKRALSIAAK